MLTERYNRISFLIKNDNLVFESVASDYSSIIMSYLNANITEKISLDKMSNDLHISKSHIERLFKEKYNTTPMKYFMNMKISYAANLLSATNQSVSFIARTVGIDDPKYLSKCIRKKYGFSPSKYRKQKNVAI